MLIILSGCNRTGPTTASDGLDLKATSSGGATTWRKAHLDTIYTLPEYCVIAHVKVRKLAYYIQKTGHTKEGFEGTSPDLCFRLLRQKRCKKCWPGDADYFPVSEYPMFNFGAIAVLYLHNRPKTCYSTRPSYQKVAVDSWECPFQCEKAFITTHQRLSSETLLRRYLALYYTRVIVGFSNKLMHPDLMHIEEFEFPQIEELERPLHSRVLQTDRHGIGCGIDIIWNEE